jgi:glycerol-3-phosphate cytidylyltransferase
MKVLTIGTFDLFHEGHLHLLQACRKLAGGDIVAVGVNTDEFVKKFKGEYPVNTERTRAAVVDSCRYVNQTKYNTDGGEWLIKLVRPDILVIGSDWAKKDYLGQIGMTQHALDSLGILLVYVPYTEGISSTMIKERMR